VISPLSRLPRISSSALREWERIAGGAASAVSRWRRPGWPLRLVRLAAKVVLVIALPFVVMVKVAVLLYAHEGVPTGLALAAGTLCTAAVVTGYAAWVWHRVTGHVRLALVARRFALPFALAYSVYALVYFSSSHAKSDQVRAYYSSLHPLLRVALSTLILIDRDMVVTDLTRRPEDYALMKLPQNDGSLHYIQRDGYAHAADLRTAGRSWVKNRLVQLYFWSMGFSTLRHAGTADHLHVELPVH
jgi:hypothetical protein